MMYTQERSDQLELDSLLVGLKNAINERDLDEEIDLRYTIIEAYVKNMDYNEAYMEGIRLEDIINKHPNNKVSRRISPYLYHRMGWLLATQVQYVESIKYYEMASKAAKATGNDSLRFSSESTISFHSHLLGHEEKAHAIAKDLMNEAKAINDEALMSIVHNLYYLLYKEEGKYEKELYHIKKTSAGANPRARAYRNVKIGTAFLDAKLFDSALVYTQKGLIEAKLLNERQLQSNSYIQLKYVYEALGDYKNALESFMNFHEIERLAHSYKSGVELGELKRKYFEEKSQIEKQIITERLNYQRAIIWSILFALLLLTVGFVYISKKLKLIKKQRNEIELQKNRAEQSEKHKEEFLANMSHEIRTPMHAISGMTNSLLRNPHPKDQRDYLNAMKTSSDNLLLLLDDILDLSKIESGKLKLSPESVDPIKMVKDVIQILKFKAKEKNLALSLQIADDIPREIMVDASRISQVLINLVGNAIKFTSEGSISIALSNNNSMLRFAIIDTGIGIEPGRLHLIFDYFEQGEHSRSRIYGGTGLGLSISKKLIDLHGGKIWAESEVSKGSTFYFELPIEKVSLVDEKKEYAERLNLNVLKDKFKGLKVMVVDDDEFNLKVVKDDLNFYLENVKIDTAKNGLMAIDLFKSQSYDLILMDIHMPVMDGYESIKFIREIETNTNQAYTPIIVMTANTIKSKIEEFFLIGADAYVSKPYNPDEMIKKLYNLIVKSQVK